MWWSLMTPRSQPSRSSAWICCANFIGCCSWCARTTTSTWRGSSGSRLTWMSRSNSTPSTSSSSPPRNWGCSWRSSRRRSLRFPPSWWISWLRSSSYRAWRIKSRSVRRPSLRMPATWVNTLLCPRTDSNEHSRRQSSSKNCRTRFLLPYCRCWRATKTRSTRICRTSWRYHFCCTSSRATWTCWVWQRSSIWSGIYIHTYKAARVTKQDLPGSDHQGDECERHHQEDWGAPSHLEMVAPPLRRHEVGALVRDHGDAGWSHTQHRNSVRG